LRHSIGDRGNAELTIAEITIGAWAEARNHQSSFINPEIANAAIIDRMAQSPNRQSSINRQSPIANWTRRQPSAASLAQQFTEQP